MEPSLSIDVIAACTCMGQRRFLGRRLPLDNILREYRFHVEQAPTQETNSSSTAIQAKIYSIPTLQINRPIYYTYMCALLFGRLLLFLTLTTSNHQTHRDRQKGLPCIRILLCRLYTAQHALYITIQPCIMRQSVYIFSIYVKTMFFLYSCWLVLFFALLFAFQKYSDIF